MVDVGAAGSDDEEVLEGEGLDGEDGVDGKVGGGLRRRAAGARRSSLPRGGPAFGFTEVER